MTAAVETSFICLPASPEKTICFVPQQQQQQQQQGEEGSEHVARLPCSNLLKHGSAPWRANALAHTSSSGVALLLLVASNPQSQAQPAPQPLPPAPAQKNATVSPAMRRRRKARDGLANGARTHLR